MRVRFWLPFIGIFLAIGAVMVLRWSNQRQAVAGLAIVPGHPLTAFIARHRDSGWLVLVDAVNTSVGLKSTRGAAAGFRVRAVDVATGDRTERVFANELDCWPARGGHVWCGTGGDVLSLELPSLRSRAEMGAYLTSLEPTARVSDRYRGEQGDLVVQLTDGRVLRVNGDTLAFEASPLPPPAGHAAERAGCHEPTSLDADGGSFFFSGGPQYTLGDFPDGGPRMFGFEAMPTFLDLGRPGLVLIRSDSGENLNQRIGRLTRVDASSGQVLWSVDSAKGPCEAAELVNGVLVAAFEDPHHRAAAIDLESGAVRWLVP